MKRIPRYLLLLCLFVSCVSLRADRLLLIQGAAGDETFRDGFSRAAQTWVELAKSAAFTFEYIDPQTAAPVAAKERIENWIQTEIESDEAPLWIVYLGHGTSGAEGSQLNLPGPDISAAELSDWLAPYDGQLVFIHGGSASGPFLPALSKPGRVVVTATRSGTEENYARFGEYFAASLLDERSDIDLDGRVSVLEAFISAGASVETFYREAGRLTSEHAMIDDNGDGRGTLASEFKGLRSLSGNASDSMRQDGREARKLSLLPAQGEKLLTAEQITQRDLLEEKLDQLYSKKQDMSESEYFDELEALLMQLSQIYVAPGEDS